MSQSPYLFSRAWSLEIAAPGQPKAIRYGNVGENSAPLRIAFEIDKNTMGTSNKSKISLFNLSPSMRDTITKGYLLRLAAGYVNTQDVLFVGNVFQVSSTRSGADISTVMECGDGEGAITYSKLNKTYAGPIALYQILQDCAKAMEAATDLSPTGVQAGVALGIPNIFYQRFTAEGPVRQTLERCLKPLGMEWNIQNGKLNILPVLAHTGDQAQLISPATGLINLPSVDKSVCKFTALLNPKLVPGALVKLESTATNLSGVYKIRTCKFTGDSYEPGSWSVACEANAIPGGDAREAVTNTLDYSTAVV